MSRQLSTASFNSIDSVARAPGNGWDLGGFPGPMAVLRNINIAGENIRENILSNAACALADLPSLCSADIGWQNLAAVGPSEASGINVLRDIIGFVPYVGATIALTDLLSDIGTFVSAGVESDIYPSLTFSVKLADLNRGHSDRLIAMSLRSSLSLNRVYGVRFVFWIDESLVRSGNAAPPWFFLKVKNHSGTFIGFEVQTNRGSPTTTRQP